MKPLIIFSAMFFLSSPEISKDQLLPTKLNVTVIDELGNFVEGAQVSIYEFKENYLGSKNAIASMKTDNNGDVTFKGVKNISYFVEAKEGDKNNNAKGVKTDVLEEGKINKVNTVIE